MITFAMNYIITIETQIDKIMRIHEGIQLWKHDWCVAGKLFLGMLCSKVMMLVMLMMTALTNTFAYDQWHLSAADIETGKAYWISFVSADHKNLSTEPTSVTKANGYSDNWYAESLFYQLANRLGGKGATFKPARNYIDRLVTRAGADQRLVHVADGSGLSLYNYVTPDMETQLLRFAWKSPEIIEKLMPSLPVAGIDGTLKSRMKGTLAQGNVHAKTGTVTGVSALAGYCTASNGHRLCFSIINQGIPKAKVGRDFQDRVCALLCR